MGKKFLKRRKRNGMMRRPPNKMCIGVGYSCRQRNDVQLLCGAHHPDHRPRHDGAHSSGGLTGFDAGKTTAELAKLYDRSRAAIEARLLKLGKIDSSALTVQLRYRGVANPT
jgi:hypothetical protein